MGRMVAESRQDRKRGWPGEPASVPCPHTERPRPIFPIPPPPARPRMSALHTPLFDWHVARGARMTEFGGWDMPVLYTSVVAEHQAVRSAAGLFDISHM